MRKKNIISKVLALSLVLAVQITPLAYASDVKNETVEEQADSTKDSPKVVEEQDDQEKIPEVTEGTEDQEKEPEDDKESGGTEEPAIPGETGRPGWLAQGNDWYYYDANGAKAYGWRAINGSWYYLDRTHETKPGIMLADTRKEIDGQIYFFGPSGGMQSGWIHKKEGWYYAASNGMMCRGWQLVGDTWYYLDGAHAENPGLMAANAKKVIGNAAYFFSDSGAMQTGWIQKSEGWYYTNGSGMQLTGWVKLGNIWYYLDGSNAENPGLMAANAKKVIGNATYFFDRSGAMRMDWIQEKEGWYYGDDVSSTGWKYIRGAWYYLDSGNMDYPGLMTIDCKKEIAGMQYFFDTSGAMKSGWVRRPEGWYYTNGSGAMKTGWLKLGTSWYYLDGSDVDYPGRMLESCEKQIGAQTYVFTASGAMRAGWVQDANKNWYYYDTNSGQMLSGWQYIGGAWYYLDPLKGNQMLGGGWHVINGAWYYLHGSGAMATNWLSLGADWYYLGGDGSMKTGWQLIGGTWYYMYQQNDPNGGSWGVMARNTTIDGYHLQGNGAMLSWAQSNMSLKAQSYGSATNYLILVDRASCKVGVFSGWTGAWNLMYFWDCSPGAPATPTVGGTFTVQSKGYYFDSGSSRCYWYTQFYGNYLFHSVLYNKYNGSLNDGRLGMQLSHGCVRLDINNAKWIYDNIPRGTKVVVY